MRQSGSGVEQRAPGDAPAACGVLLRTEGELVNRSTDPDPACARRFVTVRRGLLLFVSVSCAAVGAGLLFAITDDHRLAVASTPELAGLAGLFVLPWLTLALDQIHRAG